MASKTYLNNPDFPLATENCLCARPCAQLKESIAALETQRDQLQQEIRSGTGICAGSFKPDCERQLQLLSQQITTSIRRLNSGNCTVPLHTLALTDIQSRRRERSRRLLQRGAYEGSCGRQEVGYMLFPLENAGVCQKTQIDDQG